MVVCALAARLSLTAGCASVRPAIVQRDNLVVHVLYPTPTSRAEMGQTFKGIVSVFDRHAPRAAQRCPSTG